MGQKTVIYEGRKYTVATPDDATDEEIVDFVRKNMVGVGTGEPVRENYGQQGTTSGGVPYRFGNDERPGIVEGMARSTAQGASLGTMDEAVAAANATIDPLTRGNEGVKYSDRYEMNLANERGRMKSFAEDHPYLSAGAEVVGSLPMMIAAPEVAGPRAMALLRNLPVGGRVLAGGAAGASQAGLYGYAAGEGGATPRTMDALRSAGIGGGLGVAAPVVGMGARSVGESMATGRLARELQMSRPAYNLMSRTMGADDSLTGMGAQRMAAAGPSAMLADAGPNARSMLDTIIQRSGPGGREALAAIEGRASQAGQQVNQALDSAFGGPAVGPRTLEEGIRQGSRATVDDLYQQAYRANPAIESRLIDRILETPAGRQALQNAAVTMQNSRSRMAVPDSEIADQISYLVAKGEMAQPKGGVGAGLNLRSLDLVKRELWDIAERNMKTSPFGEAVDTTQSRAIKDLWRDLVRALDDADVTARTGPNSTRPEGGIYRQARAMAEDSAENRAAVRVGSTAMSPSVTRDALRASLDGMDPAERAYVGRGIRAQIDDTLANVRRAISDPNMDAREAMKAVKDMSSRSAREKVALVIGNDAADTFFGQLDQAAMALELRAGVAQNSKTFARQAMNEQVQAVTDDGVINAIRSGEPVNAGRRFAQTIMGRTAEDRARIRDELDGEIVSLLTGPNGRQLLQNLTNTQGRAALQGQQMGRLTELLTRRAALPTVAAENSWR